jgi:hypothetical protein
MKPRERWGQVSIASAAPAGHSAPMPIPNALRNRSNNQKLGARPASRLQPENQAIEYVIGRASVLDAAFGGAHRLIRKPLQPLDPRKEGT